MLSADQLQDTESALPTMEALLMQVNWMLILASDRFSL